MIHINNSLHRYDILTETLRKVVQDYDIKYFKINVKAYDDSFKLSYYNKKKQFVTFDKIEIYATYFIKTKTWSWAWNMEQYSHNMIKSSIALLNYGNSINDDEDLLIKKLLTTPLIKITNTMQLDLLKSLPFYLNKTRRPVSIGDFVYNKADENNFINIKINKNASSISYFMFTFIDN